MMLQEKTDAQFLHGFVGGDAACFASLAERHAPWVFGAAHRQLGDRELAEDATQAVFILLARRAGGLVGHGNLSGWLFVTVQYTVRAIERAERRRRTHERRAAMNRVESQMDPPVFAGTLDAAVATLPAHERNAVLLRFYQGMEFAEVAGALGISEMAARKRVARAVERLRGRLGEAFGAGSLSVAAMHGVPASAGVFSAHVAQAALSAASGVPVTASVGAATKGASLLMTMASLKSAAIMSAAAMVVLAGGGLAAWSIATPAVTTEPAAVASAATPDPAMEGVQIDARRKKPFSDFVPSTDAASLYKSPDQADHIVRIAPPFPAERLEFFKQLDRQGTYVPGLSATEPSVMLVQWKNGRPIAWDLTYKVHPQPFATAEDIIQSLLSVSPPNIEGPTELLARPIGGDFMVCADGTALENAWRRGVEKLLSDAVGGSVTMNFQEVDRPAYVFRGTWSGKLPDGTPWTPKNHVLQVYAGSAEDVNKGGSWMGGTLEQFSQALGRWVNQSVIFEAGVDSQLSWHVVAEGGQDMMHDHSRDPAAVIKHIEEQTGLTATVENRKIRRLLVEWRK